MPAKKKATLSKVVKSVSSKKTSVIKPNSASKKTMTPEKTAALEKDKEKAPVSVEIASTPIKMKGPVHALPRSERIQTAEGWRRSMMKKMASHKSAR